MGVNKLDNWTLSIFIVTHKFNVATYLVYVLAIPNKVMIPQ